MISKRTVFDLWWDGSGCTVWWEKAAFTPDPETGAELRRAAGRDGWSFDRRGPVWWAYCPKCQSPADES